MLVRKITIATFLLCSFNQTSSYEIIGDNEYWDSIFSSREPRVILDAASNELSWTEGPVWLAPLSSGDSTEEEILFFSDTIENNIYRLDLHTNNKSIILENSGDACQEEELIWRLEPGSNGLAIVDDFDHRWLVVCQHDARRVLLMDIRTGQRYVVVDHSVNGRRLNGPNDIIVRKEIEGSVYIYFTDPVYAWLEKEKGAADLPYLDDQVLSDGPGFCGVYRYRLDLLLGEIIDDNRHPKASNHSSSATTETLELIAKMDRPNGIAFLQRVENKDILVVSSCCQGKHIQGCQQGTSRWNFFRSKSNAKSSVTWDHFGAIEDQFVGAGCADGFKTYIGPSGEDLLIASCTGGLCLVSVEQKKVIARLSTASAKCKISNVAVTKTDRVLLTGNCGIMDLPLRKRREHLISSKGIKDEF